MLRFRVARALLEDARLAPRLAPHRVDFACQPGTLRLELRRLRLPRALKLRRVERGAQIAKAVDCIYEGGESYCEQDSHEM